MCGIAGKLFLDESRPVAERDLQRMIGTLAHRGPDGQGIWTRGNVGLAHSRLAIIDLRTVAAQPMSNEDGSVWITFNGEIYNFHELRKDLENRGHVFRTNSDTETIIHAYEEYGKDCLGRLRGMFAFAIWDCRTQTLFMARDRVGKKPLYYYVGSDRFLFGSEIKAILADDSVPVEPEPVALDHFLALQYVPAPLTAFKGIQKLPAAHWLELRDGCLKIGRYWKLSFAAKRQISMGDAVEELRWRIAEAVRLRLVSDVPLGAFLSGGIDSSAIVAFMAQATDRPVRTFTVGFEEAAFDERRFARLVAERFATDHTELMVKPSVIDLLPQLVWHYEEPFGDSSAVPTYAIAQLTRKYVTVVLNGDGGDENFAGYDRYVMNRRARRGDVVPLGLRRSFAAILRRLPAGYRRRQPFAKLSAIAEAMAQPADRRYAYWIGHFSLAERHGLYTDAFRSAVKDSDPEGLLVDVFARTDAVDWIDATLDADVNLYLTDDLLVKLDRSTMANSLEARSPFLDHVLMEFVACLPSGLKLLGVEKKRVLKAALRGLLPDEVLDRRKMGFCVPLAHWFRTDLREMAHDVLLSPRALQRGYFRSNVIAALLAEHSKGQADHAEDLWDLLMLELWHRTFIDGKGLHRAAC